MVGHQACSQKLPGHDGKAPLNHGSGQFQERDHEQEPAVNHRVFQERNPDAVSAPGFAPEQGKQNQRYPRNQDQDQDLEELV